LNPTDILNHLNTPWEAKALENKKLNYFASRLILSTTTISCNTDMPQSRGISKSYKFSFISPAKA